MNEKHLIVGVHIGGRLQNAGAIEGVEVQKMTFARE